MGKGKMICEKREWFELCVPYTWANSLFKVSRSGFDGYDVLRAGLSKKVSHAL